MIARLYSILNISYLSYLYIFFIIFYGIRLSKWSEDPRGYCYDTSRTSTASASHPAADEAFLAVTTVFYWLLQYICKGFQFTRSWQWVAWAVLSIGSLQFALHMWACFALRSANEHRLEHDDKSTEWAFGQTVAIVTLVRVVLGGVVKARSK